MRLRRPGASHANTLQGDPLGCFAAARQLLPLVEGEYDPDIVFDVPINKAKHNQIVGKRGITIAALSATYETRLMVPPNELMSNVGPANYWEARKVAQEQKQNEAGSTLLFGGGNGSSHVVPSVKEALDYGGLEPNIVQLEGEIDNVEKCLVKVLVRVQSHANIKTLSLLNSNALGDCIWGRYDHPTR